MMSAHGGHCKHPVSGVLLRLAWLLSMLAGLARANCECGFSVTDRGNETDSWVFAEMLEVDFSTVQNMTNATGWIRQEYNVSAEDGRGEYGKAFMANNAEPMVNAGASGDKTSDGLDRVVLGLRVNGSLNNDAVPAAEIDSARLDLHWGSYRTGMKVAGNNGTCSAFFWYFNDTQEIDMEFLSREFDPASKIYPISLVMQSRESKEAGYDAAKTGAYQKVNLTFDPTADFHEYRFDYTPGRVVFFADSTKLAVMEGNEVLSVGGHLILQHWSNGNPLWSGGPPESDAVLEISYVKAYFNTSDPLRLSNLVQKCRSHAPEDREVCPVPDVKAADARTGGHFFSKVAGRGEGEQETAHVSDERAEGDDGDDGDEDEDAAEEKSGSEGWRTGQPTRDVLWMAMTTVASVSMWLLQIYA